MPAVGRRVWICLGIFCGLELLMGAVYAPVCLIRSYSVLWFSILQYLFQLAHLCLWVGTLTLSCLAANAGIAHGCSKIGIYLAALLVKDVTGNLVDWSNSYGGMWRWQAILPTAIADTLINMTLVTALWSFGLFFLARLIAFRNANDPRNKPRGTDAPIRRALLLIAVPLTLRSLIWQAIGAWQFAEEHHWLLRTGEKAQLVWDLLFPCLAGLVAYLASRPLPRLLTEKQTENEEKKPGSKPA